MQLKLIQKNNENVLAVTFYGQNRNNTVLEAQKKVFEHFNFPVNYIEWPFHITGHGQAIQHLINQSIAAPIDYYLFIDMDAVALRKDFIDDIYDKIRDKKTIYGPSWTSNHKSPNHVHAASCFIAFSRELYIKLGQPTMTDLIPRSDTGEELSYVASEKGYNICLVYPKSFCELTDEECKETSNPKYWNLGGRLKYGLMTQYSDIFIHCGMQNIKRGNQLFIQKCKEIIGEDNWLRKTLDDAKKAKEKWPDWAKDNKERKLECITICVGYSKFLKLTYPLNKDKFDNFIIVTAHEDVDTQNFCLKNNIQFELTDRFYKNGAIFDKGSSINEGLLKLKYNSFVCHLDCDIVLPDNFRDELKLEELDSNILYGCRRFFIDKYQDWIDYKEGKRNKESFTGLQWGGWGCGFIQIWDMQSSKIKGMATSHLYPSYPTAGESDILMLKRFHPDVVSVGKLNIDVAHLGNFGVNHDTKDDKGFFNN